MNIKGTSGIFLMSLLFLISSVELMECPMDMEIGLNQGSR
jgi:hypothetical protein